MGQLVPEPPRTQEQAREYYKKQSFFDKVFPVVASVLVFLLFLWLAYLFAYILLHPM